MFHHGLLLCSMAIRQKKRGNASHFEALNDRVSIKKDLKFTFFRAFSLTLNRPIPTYRAE